MAIVTVGDILDTLQEFDNRLEAYYADLRDRAEHDGVRLLTYYLVRHKRHLPKVLGALSKEQLGRIRKTPLKLEETGFVVDKCFEGRTLPSDVSGDAVLDTAIQFVEMLIGFCRRVSERPLGAEATGFFKDLVKIEEKDIVELKKTKATHYF